MSRQLFAASALAGFCGGVGWGLTLVVGAWMQDQRRRRRRHKERRHWAYRDVFVRDIGPQCVNLN